MSCTTHTLQCLTTSSIHSAHIPQSALVKAQPVPPLHDPAVAPFDVPPTHVPLSAHQPQTDWLLVHVVHDVKDEHAASALQFK